MAGTHEILVVDDSKEIQIVVCAALRRKYSVTAVSTFKDAILELNSRSFSLVILDVELPDGDGFKICAHMRNIKRHKETKVIFLSGKKMDSSDKVLGFSLGADDYIVKPIDLDEFQARIDARIRRVEEREQQQENILIDSFRIIPSQYKVCVINGSAETSVDFTTMEYKLFFYLLRSKGQILSREQILNAVWGELANVTDRTVDTHIYTIRKKLGHFGVCIESVPRVGYRYSQNKTPNVA